MRLTSSISATLRPAACHANTPAVRAFRLSCFPLVATLLAAGTAAQRPAEFPIEETTIAAIHAAMKAGTLTCRALVDSYLRRIDRLDKIGPALNAIVVVNPNAPAEADALDLRFKQGGLTGALHCIPADRQRQLRDGRLAERRGFAVAPGLRVVARRVPGGSPQARRRHRSREIEHGGVRVHARTRPSARSCPATRRTRTRSIASPPARAAARRQPSPRTSVPSGSAATPATRFAARRRTRRWSASDRRWG